MSLSSTMSALVFVPVPELSDKQQFELLAIRNQQIIRESSYSSHVIAESEHLKWIEQLEADPAILFYAVCMEERIVGGVGLRKIDPIEKTADWSFYVSEHTHGQGVGLALGVRALDLFFNELQLRMVIGEALVSNPASLSYHEKLGFVETARQQHVVQPGGRAGEIAVFSLWADAWRVRREELLSGM